MKTSKTARTRKSGFKVLATPQSAHHRTTVHTSSAAATAAAKEIAGSKNYRIKSWADFGKAADLKHVIVYVREADPLQRVAIEREGVNVRTIKQIAANMELTAGRIFSILGVPKATANRRAGAGERIAGASGQTAVALLALIGEVEAMVAESTSPDAVDFDAAKWLGQWIERPQPSLGGQKPADLLDTPTGVTVVSKALGAVLSGAYQ